jgi:outer membrane receptor protein involved in Fe transport
MDGYFFILNVPPGTYTLKTSMMGYASVVMQGVTVDVDRTFEANFRLSPAVVEAEEVVVLAREPIIKKDLTASVNIVRSADVDALPYAEVGEIVVSQAGVLGDEDSIHIRGGRQDEVVYVVDGVEVRDPYSNYTISGVPLLSMEETAVNRGGFDVDQGSVSSGAINVVTKEGSSKYEATLRVSTTDLSFLGDDFHSFFDANLGDPYLDLIEGTNTDLTTAKNRHKAKELHSEFALGGPLIPTWKKGAKFFLTVDFKNDKGRFPLSGDPDYRDWVDNYQWKITVPAASFKIFTSGFYRNRSWKEYRAGWRLAPDNTPLYRDRHMQFIFGINHVVSPKTYWELRGGLYDRNLKYENFEDVDDDGVDDFTDRDLDGFVEIDIDYFRDSLGTMLNIDSIVPGAEIHGGYVEVPYYWWEEFVQMLYPCIGGGPQWWSRNSEGAFAPYNRFGWGQRSQPDTFGITMDGDTIAIGNQHTLNNHTFYRVLFYKAQSRTYSLTWRLNTQIGKSHEILVGSEYKNYNIKRYGIDYASGGNIYNSFVNPGFEKRVGDPWNFIDWYDEHPTNPWIFAAYIRDKIEIEGMVAKVGVRFDYYDPGGWAISDTNDPFVRDTLWGSDGIKLIKDAKKAEKSFYISPRIGVSHPVTERDVLHFTYGHYFQIPQFSQILRDYVFSGGFPIIGNSDVQPEKVVSYELGVKHAFTNNLYVDVTSFYKDIWDWTRLRMFPFGAGGENYSTYVNEDYGSVRGVEIEFQKKPGHGFMKELAFTVNYSFQVARGSFSTPRNAYDWAWRGYPLPPHESPLEWDQRHNYYIVLSYHVPKEKPLFGLEGLNDLGLTVIHAYGSGFPYTPPIKTMREAMENINAARMPSNRNTDLRFFKSVHVKFASIRAFLDVYNVFNQKPLNDLESEEWYETFGDPEGETKNPEVWGSRRTTRIGLEIRFR